MGIFEDDRIQKLADLTRRYSKRAAIGDRPFGDPDALNAMSAGLAALCSAPVVNTDPAAVLGFVRHGGWDPYGFDPWKYDPRSLGKVKMEYVPPVDFGPPPTLAERYASFRATVERVVREEAPNAAVKTDRTRRGHGVDLPESMVIWFECGTYRRTWTMPLSWEVAAVAESVRQHCMCCAQELGARAMGKR